MEAKDLYFATLPNFRMVIYANLSLHHQSGWLNTGIRSLDASRQFILCTATYLIPVLFQGFNSSAKLTCTTDQTTQQHPYL